jgi:hypothetical protein
MEKRIAIQHNIQSNLNAVTLDLLMTDLEEVKTIKADGNEVIGKTKHGFNFRKLFNSIVIF